MKRILFFTVIAVLFALTGCRPTSEDPYEEFKANATPRWESGSSVQLNDAGGYTFITDAGGALFSSAKYKTGRISQGGADYELVEFSGAPAVGIPADPSLRKPSRSVDLYSLKIVKVDGGKLWIVFQETESSTERRIVQ